MLILSYHAAPTTESEIERPIPTVAHIYGDVLPRNLKLSFAISKCNFNIYFNYNKITKKKESAKKFHSQVS